jgi:hypothetical protein
LPASAIDSDIAEQDLERARGESESGDRFHRDQFRKDVHWAEARIRACKLQQEIS